MKIIIKLNIKIKTQGKTLSLFCVLSRKFFTIRLHQIARALKIENYELITCGDAADKKQYINEFYNLIRNRSPQECEDILLALRLLLPPEK